MSRFAAFSLALIATPALAHPGHIAEQAGHAHWVAIGATLTAAAIIVMALVRAVAARRRRRTAHD